MFTLILLNVAFPGCVNQGLHMKIGGAVQDEGSSVLPSILNIGLNYGIQMQHSSRLIKSLPFLLITALCHFDSDKLRRILIIVRARN